jgi:accessory gene regulator protein AgrB
MLDKIKALPEKVSFSIGLTLLLFSGILLFLFSVLFPISIWTTIIIQGIVWLFAFLFIQSAAEKRHSRSNKI